MESDRERPFEETHQHTLRHLEPLLPPEAVPVAKVAPPHADGEDRGQAAQYSILLLALVWLVAGGVALAQLSILPGTNTTSGLGYTQLGAAIALGVGVLLALVGSFAWRDRATMLFAGGLLVAPGLVIAIVPEAFAAMFGAGAGTGVALVTTGAVVVTFAPAPAKC
jgi:hypothetical protein